MSTVVWVIAGTGVWLALSGVTCVLLAMTKRGPRCPELPNHDAVGLIEPRISAIVVDQSNLRTTYALHVRGDMVARLHWRTGPGRAAGWYLWQRRAGWRRLVVDADLDADLEHAAGRPGWERAADLAPALSTALALDAAANLLHGPPAAASRLLRRGSYEVHAAGLAFDVVPIAFPEAITTRAGDTTVLAGHFDDRALTVLTRRIMILGGRVLAIFPAEQPHAPHPAS